LESTVRGWAADWLLYQPVDRGTAVGVLMALGPMLDAVDDGLVLLTPSDHGISNPAAFRLGIRNAVSMIESGVTNIVLFGVEPSTPVSDYGWILPGSRYQGTTELPLRSVRGFTEKPDSAVAKVLFDVGALWNTMVLVAKASALIDLYRAHLPYWAEVFARCQGFPFAQRQEFLYQQYALLPSADFSKDILTPATGLAVYAWPSAIGWTDLGTPERLSQWLESRVTPQRAVPA
jgi:mannose-1-phosphate guanylyltransferase